MKTQFSRALLFLGLVVGGYNGWVWADRLPVYFPATFDNIGVVDTVNRQRDGLVVGDVFFRVSPKTLVHGLRSQKVTLGWVEPGSRIGFSTDNEFITEIWVLPKDYSTGSEE